MSLFEACAPPYRRMTMADVRAVPPNGLACVGSFSGCGGSSLGLRMAGWTILSGVEFIAAAAATYRANFPATRLWERDVRDLSADEVLDAHGLARGELDLFEGSPPCASFSTAGMRERGWGREKTYSSTTQRTDDLFWEWARLLDGLRPRAFVAENVPGLIAGHATEEYAWRITRDLGELGYRVDARILNAASYGVPQERRRLIFVGFRRDVDAEWRWPTPAPEPHTLRQALDDVVPGDPGHAEYLADSSMEPFATGRSWRRMREMLDRDGRIDEARFGVDCERCGFPLRERHEITKRAADGRPVRGVCEDGREALVVKNYYLLQLPDLDRPCPTILTLGGPGAASVAHPTECRKFTPAELRAISGFPRDFVLTGTRTEQYERVGRAVPPPLYEAVGRRISETLLGAER